MAVFKRPGSKLYQCEFEFKGRRIRETTGCASKVDAQAYEVKRRAEVKGDYENDRLGVKRLTMGALADLWLAASEVNHRDHKNNLGRVRKLFGEGKEIVDGKWTTVTGVRPGLSRDLPVQDLTQEHLTRLKLDRLTEKNTPATINREMSLVQALLGFAPSVSAMVPERPIMWSSPNKAATLKMKEREGKLRWLTVDEEQALLASLAAEADLRSNDQCAMDAFDLVMFLLDTGARYAEVAEVRWAQIDLEASTIDLYRSKTQNESRLHLTVRTLEMLKRRKVSLDEADFVCAYVFPALKGRAWAGVNKPRGHATGAIQRHIDAVGLNDEMFNGKVTPHTFRDTFASRLVQANVSLLKVSKLLGHKSVKMTEKYAHLNDSEAAAEAVNVLDSIHGNRPAADSDPTPVPHIPAHSGATRSEQVTLRLVPKNPQVFDAHHVFR